MGAIQHVVYQRAESAVTMSSSLQYPDHFVERLHAVWGDGFLSPGGPEEVKEIVRYIELADKTVLDIGCGTGGPALVLAAELGAHVVAIDVEHPLLDAARASAKKAGLDGQIKFRLVTPGPLPFDDACFDVVFSKDALIHIPDKQAIYREVIRVLRPGGVFVASDWLGGDNLSDSPEWARYSELGHLDLTMATAPETQSVMRNAGLVDVSTRDRNAWYAEKSRHEVSQIKGPLRDRLIAAVGEEIYAHWSDVREALAGAVAAGALRPTHLRGFKPPA